MTQALQNFGKAKATKNKKYNAKSWRTFQTLPTGRREIKNGATNKGLSHSILNYEKDLFFSFFH